jgi:hypothetical protein
MTKELKQQQVYWSRVLLAVRSGGALGLFLGFVPLLIDAVGGSTTSHYGVGAAHLALGWIVGCGVAGGIAGFLLPLGRWLVGSMVVGLAAGTLGGVAMEVAVYGGSWQQDRGGFLLIYPFVGFFVGPLIRQRLHKASRDATSERNNDQSKQKRVHVKERDKPKL